jgi:hypothetical protein
MGLLATIYVQVSLVCVDFSGIYPLFVLKNKSNDKTDVKIRLAV